MVLLSAGNLSVSQSVREILQVEKLDRGGTSEPLTIWNATSMFDATRVLGSAVRRVYEQDGPSLKAAGIDFNASMIFGGQIKGEAMRLFLVYSAGNFIEATRETCFFQVGESKYGKPILDRVLTPGHAAGRGRQVRAGVDGLDAEVQPVGGPAAGPAGLPRRRRSAATTWSASTSSNPYFRMIRSTWGQRLHEVFEGIDDPRWDGGDAVHPLMVRSARYEPMRKITQPGETHRLTKAGVRCAGYRGLLAAHSCLSS